MQPENPKTISKESFLNEIIRLQSEIKAASEAQKAHKQVENIETIASILENIQNVRPASGLKVDADYSKYLKAEELGYNQFEAWQKQSKAINAADEGFKDWGRNLGKLLEKKYYHQPDYGKIIEQKQKEIIDLVNKYPRYAKELSLYKYLKYENDPFNVGRNNPFKPYDHFQSFQETVKGEIVPKNGQGGGGLPHEVHPNAETPSMAEDRLKHNPPPTRDNPSNESQHEAYLKEHFKTPGMTEDQYLVCKYKAA